MANAGNVRRVVIEVPEGLHVPPSELEERIRIELALRLYEKGIASLGQARRIAGLSKWDFLELLAKEGIPLYYDESVVVSDSSVIIALSRACRLDLLERLFNEVLVPEAIWNEINVEDRPGSGKIVRANFIHVRKLHTGGLSPYLGTSLIRVKQKRAIV